MKIDGVFSGGGVKAFAYIGALKSLEKNQLELERVAGTSAGAIVASLIATGYQQEELEKTLENLNLNQLLDPPQLTKFLPFTKWLYLYFQMGLNKGDKLEKWLFELLAKKNVYTFQDLKKDYLKVVVTDLSLGKLVVIPDDLERIYGIDARYFSVAKAVRMSCGIPYFFMPKKMVASNNLKSRIVDGALLSNFPMWIFNNKRNCYKRPVLGITISEAGGQLEKWRPVRNALQMSHALFTTMKTAHDARYISKSDIDHIIFIPATEVEAIDFDLKAEEREKLIALGETYADSFLKHWPT